jgi:hypothetical protein
MMRPDAEGGRESGLVRQDEDLASNSSGGNSVPTAKADIFLGHTPLQAMKERARAPVRKVLKPSASVSAQETVTAEEDLAGSAVTANPTIDSDTIIAVRPNTPPDEASPGSDPTTVNFGLKLQEYFELVGSVVTRRPVMIRALSYGLLVTFSAGTVGVLSMLDVISQMADALWTGLAMFMVFGSVLGLGMWFVDRKYND